MIVGAARRRLHAGAGRDAGHEDLGYAALAQVIIQRCADERAHSLLADEVIVGMLLQFRNKLGPIRRKRKLRGARRRCGPEPRPSR